MKALNWRYAVRGFDPAKKVSDENLKTILESGRLAPSSFGMEPWHFVVVENEEVRKKLRAAGYDQPKITDASHLVVIAYRTDGEKNICNELIERTVRIQNQDASALAGLKQMLDGAITGQAHAGTLDAWMKAQAYIPFGMMIETAALLGVDAGPMEGFSADQVDEILGLKAKNLHSTTMLALGYRSSDDTSATRPKVRRSFEEVVEFVK